MIVQLPIKQLRTDGGTQPRLEINADIVKELAAAIRAGRNLPPLVAFFDGCDHWLADGFHRLAAYQLAGIDQVEVDRRSGSVRDAILFSVGANVDQTLLRDPRDKRYAVERLLSDPEWRRNGNGWIARQCHCTEWYVRFVRVDRNRAANRRKVSTGDNTGDVDLSATRTGIDGKQYPAHRPNKRPLPAESSEVASAQPSIGSPRCVPNCETSQQPEPPNSSIVNRQSSIEMVLSQFPHAGELYRQEAALWYEHQSLIEDARQSLSSLQYATDPFSRALAALAALPDPKLWKLCPTCKGSGRTNHNTPCTLCHTGFTTR